MKTFAINTLGCKVNQYESQQIRELLERLGLHQTEPAEKPDLVVINTCCVTLHASAKSRQYIRKSQKLNPKAIIVVAGCLPAVQIGELDNLAGNINFITDRQNLAKILANITNDSNTQPNSENLQNNPDAPLKTQNAAEVNANKSPNHPIFTTLSSFKGHTRAFLKIQDGCDAYCNYCIIPKTRPNVHSKPLETVLKEAKQLVRSGHREIVVTGIFLGAYGRKTARRKKWPRSQNDKLPELLEKLAQIPNLPRIRLSSLEPADITPRLLDAFRKYPNIMPHLHLSLQSGSDNILKKMARQYNTEKFRKKIELIKNQLDNPAITCDLIVGFPGETDTDFQKTVDLAKEVGFAKMHVFGFSPRKGTHAANMTEKIDPKIIKQRAKLLRDLNSQLACKFREQFVGRTDSILIESEGHSNNTPPAGRSKRYFMVKLEKNGRNYKPGDLVTVKLLKNYPAKIIAKPVKTSRTS